MRRRASAVGHLDDISSVTKDFLKFHGGEGNGAKQRRMACQAMEVISRSMNVASVKLRTATDAESSSEKSLALSQGSTQDSSHKDND